jgi:hypothetical protein
MPRFKVALELTRVREVTRDLDAIDEHDAVTSVTDWYKRDDEELTHWVVVKMADSDC